MLTQQLSRQVLFFFFCLSPPVATLSGVEKCLRMQFLTYNAGRNNKKKWCSPLLSPISVCFACWSAWFSILVFRRNGWLKASDYSDNFLFSSWQDLRYLMDTAERNVHYFCHYTYPTQRTITLLSRCTRVAVIFSLVQ